MIPIFTSLISVTQSARPKLLPTQGWVERPCIFPLHDFKKAVLTTPGKIAWLSFSCAYLIHKKKKKGTRQAAVPSDEPQRQTTTTASGNPSAVSPFCKGSF